MEKAIDYQVLEANKVASIQNDLTKKMEEHKGSGKIDSLRQAILDYVVAGSYEVARGELKAFIATKDRYPAFLRRAERLKTHCLDLISAIETKRSFPGMMSLSYSKQQEIHEKVLSHFEELKHILKQIEVMEKEEKLIDIRSTVWFLKTATYCAFTIFALGLFIDLSMGLGKTIDVVYSAFVDDVLQYIVNLL